MALTTGLFLAALIYTARCSPLGETTVCESAPNVVPNIGVGLGPLGLNLPPSLLLQLLSQTVLPSVVPTLGSTTLCDTKANIGLPVISPYGLPLNTALGTTTLCDSVPNLGLPLLQNYGLPVPGQTTVCESGPNVSPLPLPLPYGLNLPGGLINSLSGSTTLCESAPNAISPLGLPLGLPGLGIPGLGLPYARQLGGLGLGLPLNGLGLPLNGLGLPLNGLGLPLNGLAGLSVSPYGVPIL